MRRQYAKGPGTNPNVFGIWQNEPGHSMYEDDEPEPATHWTTERSQRDLEMSEFVRWRIARGERIAAESEQRRQRIAAARSAAAAIGADVFRAFMRGVNDGD
jgi:hypothetical protein